MGRRAAVGMTVSSYEIRTRVVALRGQGSVRTQGTALCLSIPCHRVRDHDCTTVTPSFASRTRLLEDDSVRARDH